MQSPVNRFKSKSHKTETKNQKIYNQKLYAKRVYIRNTETVVVGCRFLPNPATKPGLRISVKRDLRTIPKNFLTIKRFSKSNIFFMVSRIH